MRAHGFVLFGPRVRLPALVDATDRSYIRRLTTGATITRCRDDAALTGLGPQQIEAIVDQLRPTRPRSRGRPWAASLRRRVVVACASLRTNLTVRELAAVFAISRAQVHRILVDLVPRLGALFERTQHGDRRRTWIVDGTLVPTRDHLAVAKSKNDRWSCNLQVLARHKDLRVVAVGGAGPGNRNDTVHYRARRSSGSARATVAFSPMAATAGSTSWSRPCFGATASYATKPGDGIVHAAHVWST